MSERFYHSDYISPWSFSNKMRRALWNVTYLALFRFSPRRAFRWRCLLLKLFGAKMHPSAVVYPSAKIWAPWHLEMKAHAVMGEHVNCYNVGNVTIEEDGNLAGYNVLCGGGHDIYHDSRDLFTRPIVIGAGSWLFFHSFVYPGVTIGRGAIVTAGSVVVKDVAAFHIVGGNPAKFIKIRRLEGHPESFDLENPAG